MQVPDRFANPTNLTVIPIYQVSVVSCCVAQIEAKTEIIKKKKRAKKLQRERERERERERPGARWRGERMRKRKALRRDGDEIEMPWLERSGNGAEWKKKQESEWGQFQSSSSKRVSDSTTLDNTTPQQEHGDDGCD